ncbi:MAG: glycosyltransferase family 2 protein [Candidatus Roizmanbacteria bacterium]
MTADLSIIIISYNTNEITKRCLDTIVLSLNKADFNIELIVLDNASTDGSVDMLSTYRLEDTANKIQDTPRRSASYAGHAKNNSITLKTIFSKENLGFGKGNNKAVKEASAPILLFLNSDTETLDNAIEDLYSYFMSSENDYNVVGAKLIEKDRITPQASCGPEFTLLNIFLFLFLRGDYLGITRYSPDSIKTVDWVSGACFMMKRQDYDSLSGFDEKIFLYMEEIDLFHRARGQRMKIGFFPKSKFIHLGSASSQKRTQPILQVYKGYIYYYKKHFSPIHLYFLKFLLQLKAIGALILGKVTNNAYLTETYEEALKIAKLG